MAFGQKKFFREMDLFDFTSFFALDFFNFLAHCQTEKPISDNRDRTRSDPSLESEEPT